MHGSEVNNRKRKQHMRSVPTRGTRTAAGDLVASSSCDSFYKDGRRISVGDCALFKPPQDCPPFIGIIRSQTLSKKSNLQLSVNWLYRPTEVKLGKGIPPDALPNEIFYSFHKDEIPAASLLHPCKVAFLPKGVDLPPGISSFVCWRVYDVASKHFWWLTDQDYINERQEEVDQLLYKTRIEMHVTVQSGGRSPKPVNGPTSMSQLKPGSDNINSSTSFPSHVKGKKRERGDQGLEHVKRERSLKTEDGDSSQLKAESVLKTEIAKITEKGLVETEGVEKLVQLMQPDRFDKKLDLTCRSMLASVIAATDKFHCLNRFVQLGGLPVLDEWLQDVQKGKIGDGGSPKDSDKNVEEFLWVLLCALDKLPVNLHALQMCNIGRSVNHLRTHKNLEIQKKARGLVDTWKKRVEAEMNTIDAKSGSNQAVSWPSKSRLHEISHGGSRNAGGSAEVAAKSSVTQLSASKTVSTKPVEGEGIGKSASSSPGPAKSVLSPTAVKDNQPRISVGNASELPSSTVREEKSSSSSQSHNYSHSFSGKEDARSSSAGSMSVNKMSGGASRQRKSIAGLGGTVVSGVQRETRSSRNSSLNRNSASEKVLQSALTCEKAVDVPVVEGSGHKLIVKIPNRGRSPAQSASGGSFEDPSIVNSIASSPVISEKQDQFDRTLKEKSDGCRANVTSDVNTESWQSNDFKDVLTGSDEGDGSLAAIADKERSRIADDCKKLPDVVKTASSSSGNELKSEKLREISFSSMNALIESCVKYSEANASMSPRDDIGMNLLASVAAGEMSKSDLVSPTDSPQRNIPIGEGTCMGDEARSKPFPGDNFPRDESQANDGADVNSEKQGVTACSSFSKDGLHLSKLKSANTSGDRKTAPVSSEETPAVEHIRHSCSSIMDSQPIANLCVDTCEKSDELKNPVPVAGLHSNRTEKAGDGELTKLNEEMKFVEDRNVDGISDAKPKRGSSLSMAKKANDSLLTVEDEKQAGDVTSNSLPQIDGENKDDPSEWFVGIQAEQIPHSGKVKPELVETTTGELLHCTGSCRDFVPENICEFKVGKADEKDTVKLGDPSPGHFSGGDGENKGVFEEHNCGKDMPHKESSAFSYQEADKHVGSKESKLCSIDVDEKKKFASVMVEVSSSFTAGVPESDSKLKFDLNEGFITDDGKVGELMNLSAPDCSSAVHLINPLPFSVSSVSCNLPLITVAAAAKGPFVPPDDLLKCKGELGWKGSAATSAFRPAEPRKAAGTPQASTSTPVSDATSSRQGRLPLNIDLNMPDERVLKDMSGQEGDQGRAYTSDLVHNNLARNELGSAPAARNPGGLDLDLNQVGEANDMGQYSASTSCRLDSPLLQVKSTSLGIISNGEIRRNFDLNDGPSFDDTIAEPSLFSQQNRKSLQSQHHLAGLRMNNPEIVNFSSWFNPANAYSAVSIPSVLSDRGEQPFPMAASGAPQRMLGLATVGTPFTPDVYRGSMLSSSPALPFSSTPFQYPVFPFGTSFPLPSGTFGSTAYMESSSGGRLCFPTVQSQLLGPAVAVSTQYPRPCVINISEGGSNGGMESKRKWGRQGLDLNAGPGVLDLEVRDDTTPTASRQLSVASSQALTEEQTRIYQLASGVLKRREPEGGWERAFGTSNPHGRRNL